MQGGGDNGNESLRFGDNEDKDYLDIEQVVQRFKLECLKDADGDPVQGKLVEEGEMTEEDDELYDDSRSCE